VSLTARIPIVAPEGARFAPGCFDHLVGKVRPLSAGASADSNGHRTIREVTILGVDYAPDGSMVELEVQLW
jgi:hypothetical protein